MRRDEQPGGLLGKDRLRFFDRARVSGCNAPHLEKLQLGGLGVVHLHEALEDRKGVLGIDRMHMRAPASSRAASPCGCWAAFPTSTIRDTRIVKVGEGGDQLDLFVGESPRLGTCEAEYSGLQLPKSGDDVL
jgi:hypothetical protein